ncbi:MAG: hypothetical protein A3I66_06000 [Burkholderiales bacterium RIFCSPLOWO2_02_FULL_57_36]|nr:MAG: hypothetical protein A3I66_06000 [Burkholderiales bacterium RIFCSPLOWO2_02_FULL_57_36]
MTWQLSDEQATSPAGTRIDSSPDSTKPFINSSYKIVLYHDGHSCMAEAPELPGCVVRGENYFDALKRIQKTMSDWVADGFRRESTAPKKILDTLHCFSPLSNRKPRTRPRSSPIKTRLIEKFGGRSNRELAACIGIVGADAPIMLSSAMAGNGTRKVRCAIAIALNEPPSSLWPARTPELSRSDDVFYHSLIRNQDNGSKEHGRAR